MKKLLIYLKTSTETNQFKTSIQAYSSVTHYFSSYLGKRKLDLWGCFVGKAYMYMRDGLHLNRKGAAVSQQQSTVAWVA